MSEQREAQAAAQAHRTVSDAKDDEFDAHCSVSPLLRSEIYLLTILCVGLVVKERSAGETAAQQHITISVARGQCAR